MGEHEAAQGEIDWASAVVSDGTLTVDVGGEPTDEWARRVEAVIERLRPANGWSIEVDSARIVVGSVTPGAEADVRHFLEGAVQQANADFAPADDSHDEEAGGSDDDAAMTEAFREFADEREGG